MRDYFPGHFPREFFDLIVGQRLGGGIARNVYVNRLDETTVIKFESANQSFQNANEWQLWEAHQYHKPVSKWLAPCLHISACGSILIQKRTEPIPKKLLPALVPSWASDLKQENWSLLDGKPVMHDYGYTNLLANASGVRMKKPNFSVNF